MTVADCNGLPVAIGIASGQRHEAPLVLDTLNARFVKPLPERLIGDRAYDSDPLDAELANMGVDMIAPNKSNRRRMTQDRRKLRRYRRRWRVERLFSWLLGLSPSRDALRASCAELPRVVQARLHRGVATPCLTTGGRQVPPWRPPPLRRCP